MPPSSTPAPSPPPTLERLSRPAIAYTRVSTQKQGDHGQGLEFQTRAINEFALRAGYTIMTSFSDVQTAMGSDSIRDRPQAIAAIKLALDKDWPIIVDGLDRFARDVNAVETLFVETDLKIVSCRPRESESYAAIMAAFERAHHVGEQISRTTREGMQRLKAQGAVFGNPTNLDEAQRKGTEVTRARAEGRYRKLVPVVRELRKQGHVTAPAIAEGLNAKGLRTAQGRDWTAGNMRELLRRVAALDEIQERAADLVNPIWGSW